MVTVVHGCRPDRYSGALQPETNGLSATKAEENKKERDALSTATYKPGPWYWSSRRAELEEKVDHVHAFQTLLIPVAFCYRLSKVHAAPLSS